MNEPNINCPCEAVKKLELIAERHDQQLIDGKVQFAEIKSDLKHIMEKLDKKERFSAGTVSAIINAAIGLILAFLAAKIGLA